MAPKGTTELEKDLRYMAAMAGRDARAELVATKGPEYRRGLGPVAEKIFHTMLAARDSSKPPLVVPKKLAVFIAKWDARLNTTFEVTTAKRTGRPIKVPRSVVDRCWRQALTVVPSSHCRR